MHVAEIIISVFDRVGNIAGEDENASSSGSFKVGFLGKELKYRPLKSFIDSCFDDTLSF